MMQEIFSAIGQSIHFDDLRGNFREAASLADSWIERATVPEQPQAWVWRAIIHLLAGELNAASDALDRAEEGTTEPGLTLFIQTYRLLAVYERYNTFPGGAGAAAVEISARWQGVADLAAANDRWESLREAVKDQNALLESWYVYGFLCNLRPLRYMLDSARFGPDTFDKEAMLEQNLQLMEQVRDLSLSAGLPARASYVCWCAADAARRCGNEALATSWLANAQQVAVDSQDAAGQALCHLSRGDWAAAPFSSPLVCNFALQDSSSESSALAVSLEEVEFPEPDETAIATARQEYQHAEALFSAAGAARGLAAIGLRQAYLAFLARDFAEMAGRADAAALGFSTTGDQKNQQLALTILTMAEIGRNDLQKAMAMAAGIGSWGRGNGSFAHTLGLGILLNRFGRHCLLRLRRYETALAAYKVSAQLFQALGAPLNVVQNTVDRGLILQALGDHDGAFLLLEESIDQYRELAQRYPLDYPGGPAVVENLHQRIVMLATSTYQLSLQALNTQGMERAARRLAETMTEMLGRDDPALAGQPGRYSDNTEEAPDEGLFSAGFQQSLFQQLGHTILSQAAVMIPLYRSRQARHSGESDRQQSHWRQALEVTQRMDTPLRYLFETIVWSEKKAFDQAAVTYRQYLEESKGPGEDLPRQMAMAGGELGQREQKLQVRRHHQQAFSMWMRLHQYQEALFHQEALLELDGPQWWQYEDKPWQLLGDYAEMNEMLGRHEEARQAYDRAIEELESHRHSLSRDELKTAMASDRGVQYLYFLAARAAFRRREFEAAFAYIERSKARSLLDLLAGNTSDLSSFENESQVLRQWRQLNAQLSLWRGLLAAERAQQPHDQERIGQISAALAQDQQALQQLELDLSQENPNFYQAINPEAPTLGVAEVAARLQPGDLLIEYAFLDDDLLIWTIDQQGLVQALHFETSAETLNRHIHLLHRSCQNGGDYQAAAKLLSERLLEPLSPNLRGRQKLLIIPYGAMHRLPFQVLPVDGNPLGLTFTLSYLPSASAMQFIRDESRVVSPEALAVGNPRGDLPRAGAEATFVAGLYRQRALLEDEATEPEVRRELPGKGLLHFATHGRLSEENPLNSALLLAGKDELTLYELMGLQLEADLVVLSACETAIGETTRGDDVLGLTRGLLAAGARQALVTLWKVDDLSTSLFMGAFYQSLLKGARPSEALLQAQRYLRELDKDDIGEALKNLEKMAPDKRSRQTVHQERERHRQRGILLADTPTDTRGDDFSHPYFWAPFVLVGK